MKASIIWRSKPSVAGPPDGVKIAAGFTNITRDHLDYRELANYPTAKLRLFRELVKPAASQW